MQTKRATRREQAGYRTAQDQLGLLTISQLEAMGVSKGAVTYRVRQGELDRVLPGVVGIGGTPNSYRRDLKAATLWAGRGSAASMSSAAREWGFDGFKAAGIVEISSSRRNLSRSKKLPSGRRVKVHRVTDRLKEEIVIVEGIPVTSVPWTLLDLAGIKYHRLGRVLDQAINHRLTNLGEMWLFYENEWLTGRRGVAILRNLLIDRTDGIGASDSDLEDLFWKVVNEFRLPPPVGQFEMSFSDGPGRVDFVYEHARLAIECDSVAWHLDREAFERDRLRDLELQAMGWVVLRFTWAKLKYEPHFVAEQVRHHLRVRSGV